MEPKDMNCEECKEQVFELIERESVDPEGVHAILERCPECRADFEAMKAALAAAAQLAVEQPPAEIDSAILRAAEARTEPNVIAFRRRLLQAPPWAMAAVALLAVGVGVWSIPRTVQFEGEVGGAGRETKDVAALEDAIAEREDFDQARGLQAKAIAEPVAPVPATPTDEAAPAELENRVPARRASRARKRAATPRAAPMGADSAELEEAPSAAAAPSVKAAESQAASRRLARDELDAQADAYAGAKPEAEPDDKRKERAVCTSKVASFEKRLRSERRYDPTPEEQLAIGRCYHTLGDTKKARIWLDRAAEHGATRKRASEALERLGAE